MGRFGWVVIGSSLFGAAVAAPPATKPDVLVGAWRYDTNTLHLELDAKTRAELLKMGKAEDAKSLTEKALANLAAQLKVIQVTFRKDHVFVVTVISLKKELLGKWSRHDRTVTVVMDDHSQKSPLLTLSRDNSRIHTTYIRPNFGVGTVDLVRAR